MRFTFTTSAGFIFFIHFMLFFLPREFECHIKTAKKRMGERRTKKGYFAP